MQCSYCNKNMENKISFTNLFKKNNDFLCLNCKKIFSVNEFIVNNEFLLYYFADYNDIKEDIYKIKYFGDVAISLKYKKILNNFLKTKNFDLITIAPSNKTREAIRGFNHINIICELCEIKFLNIFEESYREKQSKLHKKREFHKVNLINEKINLIKTTKNILIIDDIFTSGKTLLSLANSIKEINHNCQITFLTLAKS